MQTFYVTRGDTAREIEVVLAGTDGARIVTQTLEGVPVSFIMKPAGAAEGAPRTIDEPADVLDIRGWRVRYRFDVDPFPAAGNYDAWFQAEINGHPETFPSAKPPENKIRVVVLPAP